MHNSATDQRWARLHSKPPPARKSALLTTLSISLSCESAAEHHTAEQYSKTSRKKLQKDLRRSDRSWNTCQDFLMIPSIWAVALETERRCFSKIILALNVTPSITRSAHSFSTVSSRVNGVNCGWTVTDYHSLSLTRIQCHSTQVTPHTTLFWSRFIDSGTATLSQGDCTTATRVESSA